MNAPLMSATKPAAEKETAFGRRAQLTVLYSWRVAAGARVRLIEAVPELYADLPLAALVRGIHPGAVAARARVSRTSYYAHWNEPDAFWGDVVAHVCASGLPDLELLLRRGQTLSDLSGVRAMSRQQFQRRSAAPERRMLMLLWSKSNDPLVGAVLRDRYRAMAASFEPRFAALLGAWDREVRAPFSLGDVVTLVSALADGLMARASFDAHTAPVSLFEDALVAFFATLTRSRDSTGRPTAARDVAPPRETARVAPYHFEPVRHGSTREAVLDAFERLLLDRGYARVTIADVADRAGVSTTTVYDRFASKLNLAVQLSILATIGLLGELRACGDDASPETLLGVIFDFVSARPHVYRAAHAAHLEDPESLPYQPDRNPIVQLLAARIDPASTPAVEPAVVASPWWRATVLAALDPDSPSDAAGIARVLVHGVNVSALSRPSPAVAGSA